MTDDDLLTIGEVAERAGLRASALRFYEEAGLVRPTARVGGRRRYDRSVLGRLALIDMLQQTGFTIREMRGLLAGGATRARWRPLAERKSREVEAKIAEAQETLRLLQLALACDCQSLEGCSTVTRRFGAHRRRAGGSRRVRPRSVG